MTNLTYINDEQFINDAAKLFIKTHLNSAKSLELDMFDTCGDLFTELCEVVRRGRVTDEEFEAMDGHDRLDANFRAFELVQVAREHAISKWDATKLILGL